MPSRQALDPIDGTKGELRVPSKQIEQDKERHQCPSHTHIALSALLLACATPGFLRNDQYAIALGLVEDGKVVLGVLGCPNLRVQGGEQEQGGDDARGCGFLAARGMGAYQFLLAPPTDKDEDDQVSQIKVSACRRDGGGARVKMGDGSEGAGGWRWHCGVLIPG